MCHGAHVGEGPVLAILAMLARQSALRVAAGGSAPPMPLRCAPWLWPRQVGTGKQARQSNRKAGALFSSGADDMAQSGPNAIDILMVSREHPDEATPRPLGSIPE